MSARDGDTPDGHGTRDGAGAPGDAAPPLEPRLSTDPAPAPAAPEPVPAPEWIRTDPADDTDADTSDAAAQDVADPAAAPAGSGSAAAPEAGGRDPKRRRASKAVVIGGTLAVAAAMVGGGVVASREDARTSETQQAAAAGEWTESDFAQVCRDDQTQERLEDEECAGAPAEQSAGQTSSHVSSSGHHVSWYYIPLSGGRTVPAVGYQVGSGQSSRPASGSTTKVSSSGGQFAKSGTVSKGGFGTKGGGAGS